MTALMGRAIEETKTLPDTEQNFIAALLLENIQDSRQWDAQFSASRDVLERLFDEVMEEHQT